MAVGDFADHGTDVSALRVLHGHGSKDDGEVEEVAVHRGVSRGVRGNVVAAESSDLCAAVCVVHRWTKGDADRDLVGLTASAKN